MNSRTLLGCFVVAAAVGAPLAAQVDWQLAPILPLRQNTSLTWFGSVGRTVLFGGDATQQQADTWAFGSRWERIASPTAPSPRNAMSVACDTLRGRLVLFGGRDATTTLGDTWAFDGASWTPLLPAVSPPPHYGALLVYDEARDRVVLRGGVPSGGSATDLWEFDGTSWSLRPQTGVLPSAGATMVYDPVRAVTLCFDTALRAWDGTSWQPRSVVGLPQPLPAGPLVWDPDAQRVLLVNPTVGSSRLSAVYAWSGQDWSLVATPAPFTNEYVHLVFDAERHAVVGVHQPQNANQQSGTWLLQQGTWQRVAVGSPRGRGRAAMVYDTARERLVMYGGTSGQSGFDETYELTDDAWSLQSGTTSGGPQFHGMAFDEHRGCTVRYGGSISTAVGEWSGTGLWAFVSAVPNPGIRDTPAMAYDSLRQRTLLFGGDGASGLTNDLWSWNGSAWTNVSPPSAPPSRREARVSYDVVRDRIVLFGGAAGSTKFGDTWEYDGVQWLLLTPPVSPPARSSHVQVYDPHRQRTLVFGGSGTQPLRDVWMWDGATWTELTTNTLPDVGTGVCGAYEMRRRELVIFGGDPARAELWRLRDESLGAWTSAGLGCDAGGGTLELEALDPLAIGTTCRFRVTHLPDTFVALPIGWIGFQDQQWYGVPLPISLATLGAPSCFLWADPAVPLPMLAIGGGQATANLVVPDVGAFVGSQVFVQAGVWDFAASRPGTANVLRCRVGAP